MERVEGKEKMNLSKLSYSPVDLKEFISVWSSFYNYSREELYVSRINKKQFTKNDLISLFEWKNGSRLAKNKEKALRPIIAKIDDINRLKTDFSLDDFLEQFKFVRGLIWKTYLLHIIFPEKYPIFDQNVYRAYFYIVRNCRAEMPIDNKKKEEFYFSEYIDFFNKLVKEGVSKKKLDEALWAFGKFLKTQYGKKI